VNIINHILANILKFLSIFTLSYFLHIYHGNTVFFLWYRDNRVFCTFTKVKLCFLYLSYCNAMFLYIALYYVFVYIYHSKTMFFHMVL